MSKFYFRIPPTGKSILSRYAMLFVGVFAFGQIIAQPANDNICNAEDLTLNTVVNGDNTGATVEDASLFGFCWNDGAYPDADVWYTFTATTAGEYLFTTNLQLMGNYDTQLAIYSSSDNSCTGILTQDTCGEDGANGSTNLAEVPMHMTAGQKVFIQVDGYQNLQGTFQIEVQGNAANDDVCNAQDMTMGTIYTGDNTGATVQDSTMIGSCWGDGSVDNDVWYKFTAPSDNSYTVTTNLALLGNDDTQLAIYTSSNGSCDGNFTEIACNEDVTYSNYLSSASFNLLAGQTVFIQVDGYNGTQGTFQIETNHFPAPANDQCANAADLNSIFTGTVNDTLTSGTYSNMYATVSSTDPDPNGTMNCWADGLENPVWFSFDGNGGEYLLRVYNCNSQSDSALIDSQIAIYSGTCGNLTLEACDEDPAGAGLEGTVDFLTAANQHYMVVVDGYGGQQGTFCMQASLLSASGLKTVNKENVNVYPNPATDNVRITADSPIQQLRMYNATGKLVKDVQTGNSSAITIQTSDLKSGIYMIKYTINGQMATYKLMKN